MLSLPNESAQPFPDQYDHFDPFSQQYDPILTQPQSLPEPSSSPSSQAPLEVDELLGYSEQRGWSFPAKEHSEREPYVHGTTTAKQEQPKTETETIGLGIHIPDAQPQHPDVVEYLPSPLPASRYDPHAILRVARQPLDHSQEQADHVHQASKLPMGGQTKTPSLEWQTTADLFLQRPHVGPLHEINGSDRLPNSSFHDGRSSQDIHPTTYGESQWSDHTPMNSPSSATSDDS
ncbi:MAG: hypothetical protein L6R36_004708 [Xanthoria steineri]|nr:MAG: hypothetical protein L6R36_004708 [Xanthoria steineri]